MHPITKDSESFLEFLSKELMISINKVNLSIKFRELDNWSSLNALILISRINEETGVTISASDLSNLITVGDLFTFINKANK
jgi:acyl carrier protein